MTQEETTAQLLAFFKALSDENRLKIIGLLAQQDYSVQNLAGALGLGISTTSHHLARLAKAGLVSARTDGHYYIYSLQTDTLRQLSQSLLHEDTLPKLAQDEGTDAFERKVLATFTDAAGRIISFPSQDKKYQVILRYVANTFECGKRYSEKEVNELLNRFHEDTALLRRNLVDYGLMARQGGGREYWRVGDEEERVNR
ncbi:MAG: metalloregulator ArsR/SmtB family transcription factor [Anaerolineae bacterium]|nr:metalloregulator ArsR/SmtB family transcription factor [Anaerolineae bacterium]